MLARPRSSVLGAVAALLATALVLAVMSPASAVSDDRQVPKGVNDWSCQPSAAHPRPVVLVHGLSANAQLNWSYLAPHLKSRGYCVYALTYGLDPRVALLNVPGGTINMRTSARELDAFVTKVLSRSGASEVDLVGHSEGTVMPLYWITKLGGAEKVKRYVAWTPLYDGTTIAALPAIRDAGAQLGLSNLVLSLVNSLICEACTQVLSGSEYYQEVFPDGPTLPGVEVTTIMTKYDQLVIPYTSGRLDEAVANHVLQDICPANLAEHLGLAIDPVTAQLTFNALDPDNAKPVQCLPLGTPPPAP